MKNTFFTLEFTTHVLANSTAPGGEKDRFQRDSKDSLIWQQSWWYSAFTRAIELAHNTKGLKASDICMDLAVKAPTELYRRKFGENRFRTHEAIMPGSEVTFEAVVSDRITESILTAILEKMGKFVGLSPYGFRLGYGRFDVVSVDVAASDDRDDVEASKPEPVP